LAARRFLEEYDLPRPTAAAVLETTGAGKTRAYEVADELLAALPHFARPPGRPAAPPAEDTPPTEVEAIARAVIEQLIAHPGCVTGGSRRRYSDGYRHFVLELRERFAALSAPAFAAAVHVPEGTLADWVSATTTGAPNSPAAAPTGHQQDATNPRIQTILTAWQSWQGPFTKFCDHVQHELRIPYGRSFISTILTLYGARSPRRRPGRSPDELALRQAFTTFFPGAQWVGDGMQVPIELGGTKFTFNLELDVDAYSAALVGAAVTDQEDSDAVVDAFRDGVRTVGQPPLALLLDNREANHTDAVDAALGDDTMKIRATLGRAQNKAHAEGAFGLFQQTAPPLRIEGLTSKELAASTLALAVMIWARTLNHKPRTDRNGRSRVAIYREDKPTPAEVEAARRALEARRQKQDKAFASRRARQDPIARDLLDREFARLGLLDPDGNIRRAIARYPLDAILPGIALFEAKRSAHTLPDGADARYLLGIVRNLAHRIEDRYMAETLIRLRLAARDAALAPLDLARREILRLGLDPADCIKQLLLRALDADRELDYLFWLRAAADVIAAQAPSAQIDLFRRAAARVRSAFRASHSRRQDAIEFLAQACPALQSS
jgi:hypothetical protein